MSSSQTNEMDVEIAKSAYEIFQEQLIIEDVRSIEEVVTRYNTTNDEERAALHDGLLRCVELFDPKETGYLKHGIALEFASLGGTIPRNRQGEELDLRGFTTLFARRLIPDFVSTLTPKRRPPRWKLSAKSFPNKNRLVGGRSTWRVGKTGSCDKCVRERGTQNQQPHVGHGTSRIGANCQDFKDPHIRQPWNGEDNSMEEYR